MTIRSVLVTRPELRSSPLVDQLKAYGHAVIMCPAIKIEELELDQQIRNHKFDIVVFVSPTTVELCWEAVAARSLKKEQVVYAAVGAVTARMLRDKGVEPIFPSGEGGAPELASELNKSLNLMGRNILIMKGQGGSGVLKELLTDCGAVVVESDCYRRVDIDNSEILNKTLLPGYALNAWMASSRSALSNLLSQAGNRAVDLKSIPLFVNHSRIALDALRSGVKTIFICQSAGAEMAVAINSWFAEH